MLGSILIVFSTNSSHLMEKFAKRQLGSRANTSKLRSVRRMYLILLKKTLKANKKSSVSSGLCKRNTAEG